MRVETILASLRKLKREVDAHLALEVMLLHSEDSQITNVKGTPFRNLTKAILNLEPDQVQLEIPYRPPSESFVKQPSRKQLELIFSELSRTLGEDRLWVYSLHDQRGKIVTWRYTGSPERRIIELLKRRPCSAVDISKSLGIDLSITSELLNKMTEGGKVAMKISDDEQYYSYKENPLTGD
ncbi:hypothetical protein GWN63_05530 [Candidatus Bathyarchaeota archaeon]|nr:hypothetical protein [Candidatus Bathyarchaeota archaeon]NIU81685.1 hypothetical protein [Candidatus Bathyarchaeota archaeon]NIV68331.1 hypothetical protein [Candidatus Bathyarchaeota archaeon]NIW34869.1 hypothetical protein [Candidatus Bathyarchaeota archaeon]